MWLPQTTELSCVPEQWTLTSCLGQPYGAILVLCVFCNICMEPSFKLGDNIVLNLNLNDEVNGIFPNRAFIKGEVFCAN